MYRQLLLKAFEKAGKDIRSNKPTRQAQHLSDYILEDSGEPYGEKSLRNQRAAAKAGKEVELKSYVVSALCHYVGYPHFQDFLKEHPEKPTPTQGFIKRHESALMVGVVCTVVFLSIHFCTQTRWMVWQEDHYVVADFDEQLLQDGKLKIYKEDRIRDFKKITVDCDTPYKNAKGNTLVWYGKNPDGELEYFTSPGLHPETGNTLKELTKYMFDKYGCPQ